MPRKSNCGGNAFLNILFEVEVTVRYPTELSNATDRPDGPTAARKKSRKAASFAESAKSLTNLVWVGDMSRHSLHSFR